MVPPTDAMLAELLVRARNVRSEAFGQEILFFAPSLKHYESTEFPASTHLDFVPVSVTGPRCQLGCDHCKGVLLESMEQVREPSDLVGLATRLAERGCNGLLVSGGSDLAGHVPLLPFVDAIAEVRETLGLKVVVHTGLVTPDLAEGLARAGVECAMLDVVGDVQTLRTVYHLDENPESIERSLKLLDESGIRTVPHVVCGLAEGRLRGEESALEIIGRCRPSALVLVVLDPLPGTPMQDVEPPPPTGVASIMARARICFPRIPVMLGCARPGGRHRKETDRYALLAGLNGIAFPSEGTVAAAREMGLEPRFARECCSLAIDLLHGTGGSYMGGYTS